MMQEKIDLLDQKCFLEELWKIQFASSTNHFDK